MDVDDDASFKFDLSANYGSVKYPNGSEVIAEKKMGQGHQVKGYKGSENAKSTIEMETSYGSCKVY